MQASEKFYDLYKVKQNSEVVTTLVVKAKLPSALLHRLTQETENTTQSHQERKCIQTEENQQISDRAAKLPQ